MKIGLLVVSLSVFSVALFFGFVLYDATPSAANEGTTQQTAVSAQEKAIKPQQCFDCHSEVQELHTGSKHARLHCSTCHSQMTGHLDDPSVKPVTNLELTNCGRCHKDQYESFMHVNLQSKAQWRKRPPRAAPPPSISS